MGHERPDALSVDVPPPPGATLPPALAALFTGGASGAYAAVLVACANPEALDRLGDDLGGR